MTAKFLNISMRILVAWLAAQGSVYATPCMQEAILTGLNELFPHWEEELVSNRSNEWGFPDTCILIT